MEISRGIHAVSLSNRFILFVSFDEGTKEPNCFFKTVIVKGKEHFNNTFCWFFNILFRKKLNYYNLQIDIFFTEKTVLELCRLLRQKLKRVKVKALSGEISWSALKGGITTDMHFFYEP